MRKVNQLSVFKRAKPRLGKMDQWVIGFLCKHEDLIWVASTHIKAKWGDAPEFQMEQRQVDPRSLMANKCNVFQVQ